MSNFWFQVGKYRRSHLSVAFAICLSIGLSLSGSLAAQDAGGVKDPELKGLRPSTKSDPEEKNESPEQQEEVVESSAGKELDSKEEAEAQDTRTDLEKLIDEQVPDFDPLDVLDSANPLGKVDELVGEISKNMKEIERLLDQDDTGEANQQMQQQTLSRIDQLIDEVQKLGGG